MYALNVQSGRALLALALIILGTMAGAERPSRPSAAADRAAADSFISIKFADPKLPEIHVSGVAEPRLYGVYDSPEERVAKDRVALETPAPDLQAYALYWDNHDALDIERLDVAGMAYWNDDWGGVPYGLVRPFLWGHAFRPTPPDAYPIYNVTEYRADLAQWRRARERAVQDGMARDGVMREGMGK